ncbi:MAG: hypothetical protein KC910_23575 [Candidatus Eremiobacteraeota bacterium]|nr:hypothetical protein [Candidatus Eremiobacteraeota bacterium]
MKGHHIRQFYDPQAGEGLGERITDIHRGLSTFLQGNPEANPEVDLALTQLEIANRARLGAGVQQMVAVPKARFGQLAREGAAPMPAPRLEKKAEEVKVEAKPKRRRLQGPPLNYVAR